MSDRIAGYMVAMDEDLSEAQSDRVRAAILMLHGVAAVEPVVADIKTGMGELRATTAWRTALMHLVANGVETRDA
jgi:hypothetical protein